VHAEDFHPLGRRLKHGGDRLADRKPMEVKYYGGGAYSSVKPQRFDSHGGWIATPTELAAPPAEVADAFDEVQRAEQDEDRFVEESNQYANQRLGQARGEAAQIREAAAAYRNRVVQEAEGEAQRFISVYDEYAKAPEVTRRRLFIETMESVLRGSNKVIVEQGSGQGVIPYLPLPELRRNPPANGQNNNNSQVGAQSQQGATN
jgi:membrane protease subunit HflK